MLTVSGSYNDTFNSVCELLETNLANGDELGASICISRNGKTVLDLWGGHTNEEKTSLWTEDTIVPVWSCSKLVTNLAALMLVDRGLLGLDAPVALYWPEFAANGKENIQVRHILSHTAGLSGWDDPVTMEDLYDTRSAADQLARQKPWWTPGTASGYHPISHGHLIGELVLRVTGRTLNEFIKDEITTPLGADFHLGALEKDYPRILNIVPPPSFPLSASDENSVLSKTLKSSPIHATDSHSPSFRNAELGASNGFSNARALNAILSIITSGGSANGKQFLSKATVNRIFEEQSNGVDLVLGIPLRMGIGYGLPQPDSVPWIPEGRVCFWGGWGGSIVVMDLDRGLTISYVMNKMGSGMLGTERTEAYVRAVYAAVGVVLP